MAIDMEQFKTTYIEESLEGLDIMESSLLNLDSGNADNETINTIFRAAHSIKGGGATFGLGSVSTFTHSVETLLDQLRNEERVITSEIVALLLTSVDVIRNMLAAEQGNADIDEAKIEAVKGQIDDLLESNDSTQTKDSAQEDSSDALQNSNIDNSDNDNQVGHGWVVDFKPYPDMLTTGNDVVRMFRELAELGSCDFKVDANNIPALEDLNIEDCSLSWKVTMQSACTRQQIEEVFVWVDDDCDLSIVPLIAEAVDSSPQTQSSNKVDKLEISAKPLNQKENINTKVENSSIRVDIDKIDALINMVGELVITQSMLSQMGDELHTDNLENLKDGLSQLERNTRELQESVMRIRMIPISFAFNRFPRMIHDMCNKLGKKVELKVAGESTELDKTVMEKIGDPLVHLVRNSMDHGIESPAERIELGKPETGTLSLNAFHQGGNVIIEISDDGAGLNREKIMAKALSNGLIEEGDELPDSKIFDLLFQPGFSTAETITDVSGRGVGMDVVKKNIQALGGAVDVSTVSGQGTTFSIRLPLTLAILDGQLIRVGKQTYIIPLISIIESLQIEQKCINTMAGTADLYKLRDEYIPIFRLYEVFDIRPDTKTLHNGLLVVVEGDGQKIGLLVDDLLAQQQVVIKSLETNYKRVEGLSGATILGDGRVALIVDVAGVIKVSQHGLSARSNSMSNNGVAA